MRYFLQRVISTATIVSMSPVACAAQSHSAEIQWLKRLQIEAVPQWRAMARELADCRFEYSLLETDRNDTTNRSQSKQIIGHVNGQCFLLTETIAATDQAFVYGRNERYEFALLREGSAPWSIVWQGMGQDAQSEVGSAHEYLVGMLRLPWSISATALETLVNHPSFSVERVTDSGSDGIRFDFSLASPAAAEDAMQGLSAGTLVVDPNRRWAIVAYRAEYASKIISSANLTYGDTGPPELRRVRLKLETGPNRSSQFAVDVAKYSWNLASPPEATLTAFGLPELQEPIARRRWLQLVNVGVVLVLAGIVLWRRIQPRLTAS